MALPNVVFAETDTRTIEAAVIAGFEKAAQNAGQVDFKLYPGDPRRLFLEAIALLVVQQNALIDKTGKGNLLRYAGEDTIEDIGWLYGPRTDRLQPSAALTTIHFTLSTTRPTVTVIDAGTRLAVGNVIFSTTEALNIPIGAVAGEVTAVCAATGLAGNGFLPGQINTLIDRNPFVATAVNVTASAGGANIEDIESYRLRVRNAPESFSVAGPDGAYEFWGKTAHASISDVAVWSPEPDAELFDMLVSEMGDSKDGASWRAKFYELCLQRGQGPGHVNIVPLIEGGNVPTQEVMDAVWDILSDKTRRPLTDFVHVFAAEPVAYDVVATYWIDQAEAANATVIHSAVAEAVETYRLWQRGKLGRDIIPSELHRHIMNAGARRVVITAPTYRVLEQGQVAQETSIDVRYGGMEHA